MLDGLRKEVPCIADCCIEENHLSTDTTGMCRGKRLEDRHKRSDM